MRIRDARSVGAGSNECTIHATGTDTSVMQEAARALEPGNYPLEHKAGAVTLAVVEQTTVAVDGNGRLAKKISMPLNSVVLIRIAGVQ